MTDAKQETTEKDPVMAIQNALRGALRSLTGLLQRKDKDLQDERIEVEKGEISQTGGMTTDQTGQANSGDDNSNQE